MLKMLLMKQTHYFSVLDLYGPKGTQGHWQQQNKTKNNNKPSRETKQMSRKRTPRDPFLFSREEEGVEVRSRKQACLTFWRDYRVGRDPWLAWWEDSSASCVLSHASLICVLILSGLTRLHWGFCFKFQVLLDHNSSWAIITRCYPHQ